MPFKGVGIDTDAEDLNGSLAKLESKLELFASLGFESVELQLAGINVVRGGEVSKEELNRLLKITRRFPFQYTCHAPNALNIAGGRNVELHLKAFDAYLYVCSCLEAEVFVYHSGQNSLNYPLLEYGGLPSKADLHQRWEIEIERLKRKALLAENLGVVITIENMDPQLSEILFLAEFGVPESELAVYNRALRLDLLAQQVKEINSPNVGLCLDVGHAFLAAPYWPDDDYLAAIESCAFQVKHVHFHDNFGHLADVAETECERLALGEADNHLPPGWGRIPLAEVVSILGRSGYNGWLTLEICPRYEMYLEEALKAVRDLIAHSHKLGA